MLIGSQLVGLNSKPGRSTVTSRRLSCTGMPFSIVISASPRGPGSVVIVTAAVSGLTLIRERTLTSPRSNGPAFGLRLHQQPERRTVIAGRQIRVPGERDRVQLPSPELAVEWPIRLSGPHAHSTPGRRFRARRHASRAAPRSPAAGCTVTPDQRLLAVGARDFQREGRERPRLRARALRQEPRRERQRAARARPTARARR